MKQAPSTRPSLARDEQGAIMVLGIFMCATLVGALWYIAGIGDAIVFRERLQEAADAGAMSVAALNARGMNLIVFINLIMACVLAIRVALKTIQVALIVAEVVVSVCAAIPVIFNPLEPACALAVGPIGDAIDFVQQIIDDTRDPINNTLKGLHNAQKGIARVVPGGSVLGTRQVLDKYKPFIVESFNPFPSLASPTLHSLKDGLPVQDGSLDKLCGKAVEAFRSLIDSLLPDAIQPVSSIFTGLLEEVAKAGSSYFCEIGGSGSPPDFSKLTDKTANDNCDKKLDGLQKQLNLDNKNWQNACNTAGVTCTLVPVDPFDPNSSMTSQMSGAAYDALVKSTKPADKQTLTNLKNLQTTRDKSQQDVDNFNKTQCVKTQKKEIGDKLKNVPPSQSGSGNGMEPMKVKDGWKNGVSDGQTLSLVNAEDSLLKRSPRGVRVGVQKDKRANVKIETPTEAKFAYAQAEFFYDCNSTWTDKPCNKDEEAMWHFRWRARLRRFNDPWTALEPEVKIAVGLRAGELGLAALNKGFSLNILERGKLEKTLLTDPKNLELH